MYEKQIKEYIESKRSEMIEDLKELMVIDSSLAEKSEGKPFGDGAAQAMKVTLDMMSGYGFECKNYDNYVITADINGEKRGLDILAHLDVVPGGEGWSVTDAFVPLVKDGRIYGRGSADDKGPAVAAMYAMRAIKDLHIPLKKNVRLILGGCEECGGGELEYYYSIEPQAPASISPDADFPVINAERGITDIYFSAQIENECKRGTVTALESGIKRNMIPATAYCDIIGVSPEEVRELIHEDFGFDISADNIGKYTRVTVTGVGGHSSTPENAKNALTGMLMILKQLKLDGTAAKILKNTSHLFPYGVHHGEAVGVDMEDDESGRITASLNMLSFKDGVIKGVLDCRVPVCATKENCADVLTDRFIKAGFVVDECKVTKPHCVSPDSPFVQTLLRSYEKVTGVRKEPIAIGGGTYAHNIENAVAFGCAEEGVDNCMHGPDEFMELSVFYKSAMIFADAIIELCSE